MYAIQLEGKNAVAVVKEECAMSLTTMQLTLINI
jgi:hypothetical protein